MNNNTNKSYPGYSILISAGNYRKFTYSKEDYSITINILFFSITIASKNLTDLLDSYIEVLSNRIKELETKVEHGEIKS